MQKFWIIVIILTAMCINNWMIDTHDTPQLFNGCNHLKNTYMFLTESEIYRLLTHPICAKKLLTISTVTHESKYIVRVMP